MPAWPTKKLFSIAATLSGSALRKLAELQDGDAGRAVRLSRSIQAAW